MASSSRADTSGVTRKLVWLAMAVVVFAALYTGGWFYAASRLKDRLTEALAASQQGMHSASCSGLSVRGFPFRIGIFCDSVGIDDRPTGLSASLARCGPPHRSIALATRSSNSTAPRRCA